MAYVRKTRDRYPGMGHLAVVASFVTTVSVITGRVSWRLRPRVEMAGDCFGVAGYLVVTVGFPVVYTRCRIGKISIIQTKKPRRLLDEN